MFLNIIVVKGYVWLFIGNWFLVFLNVHENAAGDVIGTFFFV
jgi:hypothetical protein